MDKRLLIVPAILVAALGCSEAPKPAAPVKQQAAAAPAAPEEPVTAKSAFSEMYKPARTWAADLLPLSLISGEIPGIANGDGKAAMWTAVFVSPGRREARTFVWAVRDSGSNIHKGVTAGPAQSWTGATPKSKPFQVTEFAVNSDAAFKTASQKGASWLKKHPGKKASLSLVSTARFPAPTWYVMWGNQKLGYLAFINATTGLAAGK